jgi:putative ubiquitin-RnfH superfamily antitoxin RatB of RatAB toxin-antitoxin module
MSWKETLSAGFHRAREEAERAYDKGKAKVEELQTEMQMDVLAKKLGYLTFDAHRGRSVKEAARVKLLSDLTRLEDELKRAKAEQAKKAAAEKAARKRY